MLTNACCDRQVENDKYPLEPAPQAELSRLALSPNRPPDFSYIRSSIPVSHHRRLPKSLSHWRLRRLPSPLHIMSFSSVCDAPQTQETYVSDYSSGDEDTASFVPPAPKARRMGPSTIKKRRVNRISDDGDEEILVIESPASPVSSEATSTTNRSGPSPSAPVTSSRPTLKRMSSQSLLEQGEFNITFL